MSKSKIVFLDSDIKLLNHLLIEMVQDGIAYSSFPTNHSKEKYLSIFCAGKMVVGHPQGKISKPLSMTDRLDEPEIVHCLISNESDATYIVLDKGQEDQTILLEGGKE